MLWFYLLALVIFIGGEINSEVEHAAGDRLVPKERPERAKAAEYLPSDGQPPQ